MNVNISVTDTEVFTALIDLYVELADRLDDSEADYLIARLNDILGDDYFDIER